MNVGQRKFETSGSGRISENASEQMSGFGVSAVIGPTIVLKAVVMRPEQSSHPNGTRQPASTLIAVFTELAMLHA
jgi:hypothetical protein